MGVTFGKAKPLPELHLDDEGLQQAMETAPEPFVDIRATEFLTTDKTRMSTDTQQFLSMI